jgi:hypothetical protein
MKTFSSADGSEWVATAREEQTQRHHGRWYLVLHPADRAGDALMIPEVRWQSRHTAERTLRTMSDFELRRRLRMATGRSSTPGADRTPFGAWQDRGARTKGGTAAP